METEALALGAEAVELAGETDDIDVQGDVHADYGTVLLRLGRADEARTEFEQARYLYRQKGNLALERAMNVALGESDEVGEAV
jgi:Flp pilus assembly protein TadD